MRVSLQKFAEEGAMRVKTTLLLGAIAMALLLSGFAPPAFAKHGPKPPKIHYKFNKKAGVFGGNYLGPKKQKKAKGYYRNSLTGEMVYGKPKH